MVLTGLSVRKGQGKGKLLFMDRQTLDTVTEMEISDTVRFIRFLLTLKIDSEFNNDSS